MKRHPFDPAALVSGALTIAGGVLALLQQTGSIHVSGGAVAMWLCVVAAVAGAAIILARARSVAD
jgi:hypothetical protein